MIIPLSCVLACLGPGLNPFVCARRSPPDLLPTVDVYVWYVATKNENKKNYHYYYLLLLLLDYCLYYYSTINTITTTATIVRGSFSITFCRLLAQTTRSHWLRVRRATATTSLGPPISPRYLSLGPLLLLFSSSSPLPFTPFPLLSFCFASSADCPSLSSTLTLLSGLRGRYPSPRHPPSLHPTATGSIAIALSPSSPPPPSGLYHLGPGHDPRSWACPRLAICRRTTRRRA